MVLIMGEGEEKQKKMDKSKSRKPGRKITASAFWKTCAFITLLFWAILIIASIIGSYWPPPKDGRETFSFLLESLKFMTYTMTGITFGHSFISHFVKPKPN